MGHVAKHNVTLSAELSTAVEEAVASGEYPSIDAVVGEALARWKDERELFGYTIEELRALAQAGIDSGPAVDGEAALDRIKAKFRADAGSLAK
ncbi:MAG: type II toxin-antitoxin system ParD family antitoxin [Beijerinckiaceae bacterium]|nr:type II toxin-antitoxin system ParD family antitoxin [Beijerinckiaceae bacterium]